MYTAMDAAGNASSASGVVSVPERRIGSTCFTTTDLGRGPGSQGLLINDSGQVAGVIRVAGRETDIGPEVSLEGFVWTNGVIEEIVAPVSLVYPSGFNNRGQVVGTFFLGGDVPEPHAFSWEKGVLTDLGAGQDYSTADAINQRGQIVGQVQSSTGGTHAVSWKNGVMQDLGDLGSPYSYASAISESGQIVGQSDTADFRVHAISWKNGKMTDLGTLPGDVNSVANSVNARGQVVGYSQSPTLYSDVDGSLIASSVLHAVLWEAGQITDLGTLGGTLSQATKINDRGQVIGVWGDWAKWRAFIWEDGVMTDLGDLGFGSTASVTPIDINDRGQIVGGVTGPDGEPHAFFWEHGAMTDLGAVGDGSGSYVSDINERGEIAGSIGVRADGQISVGATLWQPRLCK
jgi:probable HAF family extracellular repeat protein